jgi:hypothetical protein
VPNEPTQFSWCAHPARERRGPAIAGLAIVAAFAAAVWVAFGSTTWAVFSAVVLVAALNRFYFRSRFDIDADGITARFPLRTKRVRWADTRRFVVDDNGGFLSPRATRSRIDAWRGLHVLFGSQREPVIGRIRAHLAPGDGSWVR